MPDALKCQTIYDNLSLWFGMCATVLRNTVSEIFVETLISYIQGLSKKSVDKYYFLFIKMPNTIWAIIFLKRQR